MEIIKCFQTKHLLAITNKPYGPVEINSGKTTIEGTNGVTINNNFEVKTGASLEIKTN